MSTSSGSRRAASAAFARACAGPDSRPDASATARFSSSVPLQCNTTSQPAAMAARAIPAACR